MKIAELISVLLEAVSKIKLYRHCHFERPSERIIRTLSLTTSLFLSWIFIFTLAGCKPHVSLNGATIPEEAKTISVAFFKNNTTLGAPSLSQRFTEKLRSVVSQQTNLALMAQNGDLQFDGYISDYNVAPVSIQSNDQAAQNRLTISVNVKYSNKFDPTKDFEQTFTQFADLASTKDISANEPILVTEIYRKITEDIFNRAFNNW